MFLFFLFLPRSLRTQDSLIRALKIIRLLEEDGGAGGLSVTVTAETEVKQGAVLWLDGRNDGKFSFKKDTLKECWACKQDRTKNGFAPLIHTFFEALQLKLFFCRQLNAYRI